jgi:hypothetical protein
MLSPKHHVKAHCLLSQTHMFMQKMKLHKKLAKIASCTME